MRLKNRLIWVCFVVVILLCGCTKNEEKKDVQPDKPMDYLEMTEIKEGRYDIYVIVKNMDSSYWQVILNGVAKAGEDMDCNIYAAGSHSETEWKIQEQLVQTACDRGADAILLAADDSEQLAAIVSKAHQAGVAVVLVDTIVNTEEYDLCYMTDNLMAGKNAAEQMLSLFEKAGISPEDNAKVAIQVGAISSQTINERLAGFLQYWTKYAPANWEVIDDVKCNEGDVDRAVQCATEFFAEYGDDIKGVFGTNNGSTVGFAEILLKQNKTDVCIVGFDYSDQMAEIINKEEFCAATMLQKQYDMAYLGVQAAIHFIEGGAMPVKFIDTQVLAVNKDTKNLPEVLEVIAHN